MEQKIKTALRFMEDGQSFKVGDLKLGVNSAGEVEVTGWSQFQDLRNINQKIAIQELDEIKNIFLNMVDSSNELNEFIKNKAINFILCFDDFGKSSLEICTERNGKVEWKMQLK